MRAVSRARIAIVTIVLIWIALMIKLMIADVWDETNGMLAFCDPAHTLGFNVRFVLTQSLGFWRPLPTLIAAVLLHFVRDFDVNWRLLRGIDIAMLLGAVVLFLRAIERWSERDERRDVIFTIAVLFSGSAVITAGWYANIFDASALLLIALGAFVLSTAERGHPVRSARASRPGADQSPSGTLDDCGPEARAPMRAIEAGVIFGLAFFCKETAALVFPFLLLLLAANRITVRTALRAGIPAAILGATYFAIRARIVPFGSSADVHGFATDLYLPTLINLCESFWRQTLKMRDYIGFAFFAFSLAMLKRPKLIAAALALIVATSVLYWGMIMPYQNGVLFSHLDFIGRLYLIPVTLLLVMLAMERRTVAICVLLIPILIGAFTTYRDHTRMQRTYKRLYRTALQAKTKPLMVDYTEKPLHDTTRDVEVCACPQAPVKIDERTGQLLFR